MVNKLWQNYLINTRLNLKTRFVSEKKNHIIISEMSSYVLLLNVLQKQPSRGVLKKSCSENMQQIYSRTPIEITLRYECSPANLLHIFRTPFLKNSSAP